MRENADRLANPVDCVVRATPLAEATDIDWLKKTVEHLYQLLDDIDTAGDMAKSDDKLYRAIVERTQQRKNDTGITSDGYSLFTP